MCTFVNQKAFEEKENQNKKIMQHINAKKKVKVTPTKTTRKQTTNQQTQTSEQKEKRK